MNFEWKTDGYIFEIHDEVFKLRPQNRKTMSRLGTFQRWIPVDTITAASIQRPVKSKKYLFEVSDNFSKSTVQLGLLHV